MKNPGFAGAPLQSPKKGDGENGQRPRAQRSGSTTFSPAHSRGTSRRLRRARSTDHSPCGHGCSYRSPSTIPRRYCLVPADIDAGSIKSPSMRSMLEDRPSKTTSLSTVVGHRDDSSIGCRFY